MKTTVGVLKKLIKDTMSENKFSRTVNRIMTGDEARERATEMGLAPEVVEWLGNDFKQMNKNVWARERDGDDIEHMAGENGRAAMGMSWEHALEELAEVMGTEDLEDPQLNAVFDAFYEE